MNRILQLIILIVVNSNLYSQKQPLRLYTSPLFAIDILSRPTLTLGSEFIILKHLGIATEFGFKVKDMKDYDTTILGSIGYTYRFELKYYDVGFFKIGNLNNYLSLEYRYIKDEHNEKTDYYENSQSVELITDNYGVKENIYVGNIKYGIIIDLGKRIYFDAYCGIGLRYRDIVNIKREYNEDIGHKLAHADAWLSGFGLKETSGFYLNPSLGFKFGIRI